MFRVSSEELWIFRNRHSLCIKVLQKSSVACFIHIYIYGKGKVQSRTGHEGSEGE